MSIALVMGAVCFMVVESQTDCVDELGNTYRDGESFTHSDGCNGCTCSNGAIGCTLMLCPKVCEANGVKYELGDSYMSEDGCNRCRCTPAGGACTRMACL